MELVGLLRKGEQAINIILVRHWDLGFVTIKTIEFLPTSRILLLKKNTGAGLQAVFGVKKKGSHYYNVQ